MGSLRNPVGSLPPTVYWRWRVLVLAAVLVVLALILYACSGSGSGKKKPSGNGKNSASASQTSTPTVGGSSAQGSSGGATSASGGASGSAPGSNSGGPSNSAGASVRFDRRPGRHRGDDGRFDRRHHGRSDRRCRWRLRQPRHHRRPRRPGSRFHHRRRLRAEPRPAPVLGQYANGDTARSSPSPLSVTRAPPTATSTSARSPWS